jgi:hypothetical protein
LSKTLKSRRKYSKSLVRKGIRTSESVKPDRQK